MKFTDVQRVGVQNLLDRLNQGDGYKHTIGTIVRIAGREVADQIIECKNSYRDANAAACQNGGAMLSPAAEDYWKEAQKVLAYGRLVFSKGCRKSEKVLSKKCEKLEESFASRVPNNEKGKFREYQDGVAENWDDRWHNTVDGFFPLLETNFTASVPVPDPMAEAQRSVLEELLK